MGGRPRAVEDLEVIASARGWDTAFWRGRRVLLTGHTGFKGSWLATWLVKLGAQVTGFSLPAPAAESLHWRGCGGDLVALGFTDLRGDINDTSIRDAVRQAQPELVLHLAAQAIVLDSYERPVDTWQTNVMGTLNVLQALGGRGAPATFVGVTSDKCYENKGRVWGYRENDPLGGKDPYSASKAACEILLASWRQSYSESTGVLVASARAGNVIGGGDDSPHRIMPDLMRAFAAGEPALLRNPHATRPYQHVLEPLSGYLTLARALHENPRFAQAWNFGPLPESEQRTAWLAEATARTWGGDARFTVRDAAVVAPTEAQLLMLDSSKARHELGWIPRWNLQQAVTETVAWHKAANDQLNRTMAETLAQIDRYEAATTPG